MPMLQQVLHIELTAEAFPPIMYYDLHMLAQKTRYHLFHHSCCQDHCLNHLYTVSWSLTSLFSTNMAISETNLYTVKLRPSGAPLPLKSCGKLVDISRNVSLNGHLFYITVVFAFVPY